MSNGFSLLDDFTRAYIECALWSSTDESTPSGGLPFDENYGPDDIAPETIKAMAQDCAAFQKECARSLKKAGDDAENGHDFWLTRNGHGTGFWDRGYHYATDRKLTRSSHAYGTFDLYLGDDGKIYGG